MKLSVALATLNEEKNIKRCLDALTGWVDEIIIVDESSTDNTVSIAKKYPEVKVISTHHEPIFHITKQKAIDACHNDWVFLIDADEVISPELSAEIKKIISLSNSELANYQNIVKSNKLFERHQLLLEKRDGKYGRNTQEYTAFFIPRLNYFLGTYLKYGGVYPDGVIRLFKKSQSYQPGKDVHEQIATNGQVGWLSSPLYHYGDPNFSQYLFRHDRYTSLFAKEMLDQKIKINFLSFTNYFFFKPIHWFLLTFFRHKGFLDGFPGFVFSFYSALRFPTMYTKYYELNKK